MGIVTSALKQNLINKLHTPEWKTKIRKKQNGIVSAARWAQLRQHFAFPELYFARVVSFWMVKFTWGPLLRGNNAGLKSLFWREGNRQKRLPASSGIMKQWQQLWKHHTETMTWLVEGARGKIVIRSTRAARTCRFRLTLQNGKLKAWFPYRCICRVSRTKKIHRTDITLWKPPVQMLNTKEMTDTTCCTR